MGSSLRLTTQPGAASTRSPSLLCTIFCALALLFSGSVYSGNPVNQASATPDISNGVLDLRGHQPNADEVMSLSGEWEFYWKALLTPGVSAEIFPEAEKRLFSVPQAWRSLHRDSNDSSGEGYATYRLRILLPQGSDQFALYILPVYSSYNLFIDGVAVGSAGKVSDDADESIAYLASATYKFSPTEEMTEILLQVSNHTNARGGILNSIYFGSADAVEEFVYRNHIAKLFIFSGIFLMCLYHLVIYLLYRSEKATLYFSFFCFLICVRLLFSYEYLISNIITLPWSISIRIEYLTVYLGALTFFAFIDATFPGMLQRRLKQIFIIACIVFSASVLLSHSLFFTGIIRYFHGILLLSLIYLLTVMTRAAIKGEPDARVFLFGMFILMAVTLNDVISFMGIIKLPYLTPAGVFIFVILQAFILARRFTHAMKGMEKLTRELRNSNRIKENFLATIGHEMRSPMNGIIGGVELLRARDRKDTELNIIESSANEMVSIIDKILETTQLNQEGLTIRMQDVTMTELLDSISEKYRPVCQRKGLEWQTSLHNDVPEKLRFDAEKVQIILGHLLDNAIKFTESGSVHLVVKAKPATDDTHKAASPDTALVFHVIDTGIGIGPQHREKIFEAFSQKETGYNRRFGGLGLGLALSNGYARALGGTIVFQRETKGTRFSFILNVERADANASAEPNSVACVSDNQMTEDLGPILQRLNNNRILIAEDIPANQMIIRKMAEKLGFEADLAENGEEALQLLEKNRYLLILMDCQMPIMDGYEATQRIRQSTATYRDIAIIAVTANVLESEQKQCFDAGMDAFIAKPVKQAMLKREIVKLLARIFH